MVMNLWNRFEQNFKHRQLRFLEKFLARPFLKPDQVDLKKIERILISFCEHGFDWTPGQFISFIRHVRAGYDLVIVLNTVSHSLTSDLVACMSGAKYVLGSEHLRFKGTSRNFFYNFLAPFRPENRHQSERNLDILRYIGIKCNDTHEHLTLTAAEKEWAQVYLQQLGREFNKVLIAIHPGAGKIINRWPVAYFANVANRLQREMNAQLFVTWGYHEAALGLELVKELDCPALVTTQNDIRKLAALLSQADLFLCNDTGVMHVAAAVDTPLIALFGPTDPGQWKPAGDKFVALRGKDFKCDSVMPVQVYRTAKKMLA
jgi:ADP-heptose:LPS heptosyltransferase